MRVPLLALLALLAAACLRDPLSYPCTGRGSSACIRGGEQGVCEPTGYCAFLDTSCASRLRYDGSAGPGLARTCVLGGGACSPEGWCWVNPLPAGDNQIRALWGAAPSAIWAVGSHGTLLHWDGASWRGTMGSDSGYTGIWGTDFTHMWIVGDDGSVSSFDGNTLTLQAMEMPLNAVSGTGAADLWAVGAAGTAAHFDGTAWRSTTTGITADLNGVFADGPDDAWAVAGDGTVLHATAGTWQAAPFKFTAEGHSVWGVGPSDLWLGGFCQVLQSNGVTAMDPPGTGVDCARVEAIHGLGANDVWLVQDDGAAFHWAGSSLLPVASQAQDQGRGLRAVWEAGAMDVWGAGDYGVMVHWHGAGPFAYLVTPATTANLYAVSAVSAEDIWAVGDGTTVLHYDGSTWSVVPTGIMGARTLRSVSASPSDVWIAGDAGIVLHGSGGAFSQVATGMTANLNAISGAAGDPWIAGDGGLAARWTGTAFATTATGTSADLEGLWGSGPADVWAVGTAGTLLHWTGSAWSAVAAGTNHDLYGITGTGPENIVAVGAGVIASWDGLAWTTAAVGPTLRQVAAASPLDMWATADGGSLTHYDGSIWTGSARLSPNGLTGVSYSPSSGWVAVGANGDILHHDP